MKEMESLMTWLVKLIFFLMLLPFFVSLIVQLTAALLLAILPWVIGLAVLIGLVAGVSAGLTMRRHCPPRNGNYLPPGVPPVRRPRGRGRDDD